MFRAFGFIGLLIALLIVGVLLKNQLSAQHRIKPAQAASSPEAGVSVPDVDTPAQGRQVQQQIQDDVNKAMQDRSKQLDQDMERSAP